MGYNTYDQLGFGKVYNDYEKIDSIKYFENNNINIKKVCFGANHFLALSNLGQVFAWGNYVFGQTGNGKGIEPQSQPILLNGFENGEVITISCGLQHSLAITKCGSLFSWGRNESGQLGLENCNIVNKPQRIESIEEPIEKICAGAKHSLALSRVGKIYAFGNNEFGQVGNGSQINQHSPVIIKKELTFKDIAANFECNISIAFSSKNVYYLWGKFGEEIFLEPKMSYFKSFDDIFAHYNEISYGLDKPENKSESNNGFYEKEFEQLSEIGKGSFGVVYKTQRRAKDKGCYAIKITYPLSNDKKAEMLKEVQVIWNLNNNFVVRYYNTWLEDAFIEKNGHKTYDSSKFSLYIQMELCAGNLEQFMKQFDERSSFISNINSNEILTSVYYYIYCELMKELIECVDYLHKEKKIHRDLRPENILIPDKINGKFIKIGDFGLATCHNCKSQSHSKVITHLNFAAPEIERGEDHNEKADIYSLGKIMRICFRIDNYM
jgi:hypothetical protein